MAGCWNELKLGPRDGLLEGATIVRAHDAIAFPPEHQGWDGDAMQPPAQDGIMHERFPGKARGRLTVADQGQQLRIWQTRRAR
jgi:hypothetical protein